MSQVVRLDNAARAYQLAAYTTVGTGKVQPWAGDTNATRAPVGGIIIQLDAATAPGAYIEYGGPDITPGNGLQLVMGSTPPDALVPAPNAAAIWIVPSASGIIVRGQIQ